MSYKIPLFDLNFDKREEEAVLETIQSKWISTGPKCDEFEKKFSEALDCKNAVSMANCTTALHLALDILAIKEGDEVIVPSLTFAATANCVKYVGAIPVFADITSLEDLTISPKDIEKKITAKTKAIIVMHYAGFPCNMEEIIKIAHKNSLYIVEDACHGPLSEYQGKKLGTIGDIGCFSFFSNKNMSTGEGGMLVTNNDGYYNKAKLLRSHGMTTMSYQRASGHATEYDIKSIGYNYRMDDLRASLGIVQLEKLKSDLIKRQGVRDIYLNRLSGVNGIELPFKDNQEFVSNYIMPIVLKNSSKEKRDSIRDKMHKVGVQTSVHYPAVHKFSCYNNNSSLLLSEYVADCAITLPMYSSLTESDIIFICDSLEEILDN